jgi:dGTPase
MRDERRHGPVKRDDQRPAGASDRDRILHCSALRRLAGVTQVVAPEEGHVFHNRLTHSMKVGQIGRRLAEYVRTKFSDAVEQLGGIDPEVVEAAGFAHDLGHPPFGHVTEKELHALCRKAGLDVGYEGNAQSFRILTKLAVRSATYPGLNLSRATLNAVLKYPWMREPVGDHSKKWGAYPEEEDDFKFARKDVTSGRSLEAELMNFADDVAYSIHDAEDFYRAGLIPMEILVNGSNEFERVIERVVRGSTWNQTELTLAWGSAAPFAIENRYLGTAAQRAALREWTSKMIQRYVQSVQIDAGATACFQVPENIQQEIKLLKALTWEYVIESPMLATQQMGHRKVISSLFDAYLDASKNHRSVLPPRFRDYLEGDMADRIYGSLNDDQRRVRTVADIIANMTDTEALRMYRRLHGFLPGSLSDASPM